MIIEMRSILTGKMSSMDINITVQELLDFTNGVSGLAQEAFPHLSRDEREFIISGIHPVEWNELFGELED
jgi:hypothetical protein